MDWINTIKFSVEDRAYTAPMRLIIPPIAVSITGGRIVIDIS